jgi:hypothetical protein
MRQHNVGCVCACRSMSGGMQTAVCTPPDIEEHAHTPYDTLLHYQKSNFLQF